VDEMFHDVMTDSTEQCEEDDGQAEERGCCLHREGEVRVTRNARGSRMKLESRVSRFSCFPLFLKCSAVPSTAVSDSAKNPFCSRIK
jgi:hypothetical protein